jgi:kynurenine formamidase
MKIIDLSHTIYQGMPYYPGTEPPNLQVTNTIEVDGFTETKMNIYSHIGTHIDAPSHILKNGLSLDKLPIDHFIGKALLLDLPVMPDDMIPVSSLLKYKNLVIDLDFVIIKTGWSRHWGKQDYFEGFPHLSEEAASWLAAFHLKGVGIDAISVDSMDTATFPVHKIFFMKNMIVIENLTNLDSVGNGVFTLSCMPLKIKDADGSPTRAFALLGSEP